MSLAVTSTNFAERIAQLPTKTVGVLAGFLSPSEIKPVGDLLLARRALSEECVSAIFFNNPLPPSLSARLIRRLPQKEALQATFDLATTKLTLSHHQTRTEDLSEIARRFPNLTSLRSVMRGSDETLALLPPLLESLELIHSDNVTDAGLRSLSRLPLQRLSIHRGVSITDEGILALSTLPLRSLELMFCCDFTDEGLSLLNTLPLESLNLTACTQIGNAGLANLSRLPRLRSLDLTTCYRVTDEGLDHLSQTSLESLDLTNCPRVTPAGVARLIEAHRVRGNRLTVITGD